MENQKTKLVLGTAELGMSYGLNNKQGQPSLEDSFSILDIAYKNGIKIFDTAFAYGNAEDVLGQWISSRQIADKISVISKLKPHILNDYPDGTKAKDIVISEIKKSLKRLNINILDGYLLHTPQYIYNDHIIEGLKHAKNQGLIKNFGVSIYDEAEALYAASLPVDYIQVPYNILDQRLDNTDFFKITKSNNVTVFARSPFLQGLLLMPSNKIPSHLNHAVPLLKQLDDYLNKHQISRLTATLAFSLNKECLDFIVFGTNNTEETEECIEIANNLPNLPDDFLSTMNSKFSQTEKTIITPSLWKNPKKNSNLITKAEK